MDDFRQTLYRRPPIGVQTRWASFENPVAAKGQAAKANGGRKGHAFDCLNAGETKTLLHLQGESGLLTRFWLTIDDRSPEMLRSLRLDIFWENAATPAVSAPLGDFCGVGMGQCARFESALFSNPEGRSFNCFIPMPFRHAARMTLTNESGTDLKHLFYDVEMLTGMAHADDMLYFHAHWRREQPNSLGQPFTLLPRVTGTGRYLGANIGVQTNPAYGGTWWGEGELKLYLDGDTQYPTLCGTGAEDLPGTGWGLGTYTHATQGCTIADEATGQWALYRYHTLDPVYFHDECRVTMDGIGGGPVAQVVALQGARAPLVPLTLDTQTGRTVNLFEPPYPDGGVPDGGVTELAALLPLPEGSWCNFFRQDDWCATSYFYLDSPENGLPSLAPVAERIADLR